MIKVETIGSPDVVVDGEGYTISVVANAYDELNTVVATTTLILTGLVSETKAQVKAKLAAERQAWRSKVQASCDFRDKVGNL